MKLNNGVILPDLSLGTFKLQGETCYTITYNAISQGLYSSIDTASCYFNHREISRAIKDSGVKRESLFITSKIAPKEMGTEQARKAINDILGELEIEYIDMLLLHWPAKSRIPGNSPKHEEYRLDTWKIMEESFKEGKCKCIGVSNFEINHLQSLLPHCEIIPVVNQIEFHPHLFQKELQTFCEKQNIRIQAYASLGNGNLLRNDIIVSLSKQLDKTPAQILIKWGIQKNVGAIVKASSIERIIENTKHTDFTLSDEQIQLLDNLHSNQRYCWDPSIIR